MITYKTTNLTATKEKCYWAHGDDGFYLADHTGDVFEDKYGLWLRTPAGYTKVKKEETKEKEYVY